MAQGRLIRDGRGQGTRYRIPSGEAAPAARSAVDYHIPISTEAAWISESVRAPIQRRQPVGYRRAFLDDYRPGKTWYLPAALRRRLLAQGDSPDRERPAGT